MLNDKTVQKLNPAGLLKTISEEYDSGFLEITSGLVCWKIYLKSHRLFYVSYAIQSHPSLVLDRVKKSIDRLNFGNAIAALESSVQETLFQRLNKIQSPYYLDYPILLWLLFEHHLAPSQATSLASQLFDEAFEHLLCVDVGTYQMTHYKAPTLPGLYQPSLPAKIDVSQSKLRIWQSLGPIVRSIYQRPYLVDQATFCRPSAAQSSLREKLAPALKKGYSFWQLAAFLKCHELEIVKFLYPHIVEGSIQLKSPLAPFDQLPDFCPPSSPPSPPIKPKIQGLEKASLKTADSAGLSANIAGKRQSSYSIACIDDSPSTLNQIEHFLDKDRFLIFKFSEPVKAASQIRKINPDIIFLDIGMPKVNGYELCRMLRNHPATKNVPIVVITGNRGVLNKSKAKSVGASDYITKPFTKSDLLEVIMKHLSHQSSNIANH